jgi:hypothetical protein
MAYFLLLSIYVLKAKPTTVQIALWYKRKTKSNKYKPAYKTVTGEYINQYSLLNKVINSLKYS